MNLKSALVWLTIFSCSAHALQGIGTSLLRLEPSATTTICRDGDMRVDSGASNALKICRSNTWNKITDGIIGVGSGGTGISSGTSGGIPYFSGSSAISSSAALGANQLVIGGGAGVAPSSIGSSGTTTTLLHGNASGAPSFSAVSLSADISGTLAAANGGTGHASYSVGDILYASGTTALSNLNAGTAGYVLTSNGASSAPSWQAASGGSVGTNYIANYNAEIDTTGWATYADAAGTAPVDGTGGSPSVTWTRTTSSPLTGTGSFLFTKGSSNRQGDGASYAFSIDLSSEAKVLAIDFDYLVDSGTFVAGSTGVDSDVEVWIYDITNGVLIQPSTYKLYSNSSTVPSHFSAYFQSASNSVSYRLIFHTATTSTSAYALRMDTITVSPSKYVYGTPITDFSSCTVSGSWTASTTYSALCRKVGDSEEIQANLAITGTPTSASLTINLPTGQTIDSSKVVNAVAFKSDLGAGSGLVAAAGSLFRVLYSSTTAVKIVYQSSVTGLLTNVDATHPGTFASGDNVEVWFKVPIQGWSSSVQMSDGGEQRVVAAKMQGTTGASYTSGSTTIVPYNSIVYDTHGMCSTSSGRCTIQVPGVYLICGTGGIGGGTLSAGSASNLYLYVNGTLTSTLGPSNIAPSSSSLTVVWSGCTQANLLSGDIVDARANLTASGTLAFSSGTSGQHFEISRVAGPTSIAANELIAARYTDTSGGSITTSFATFTYATKLIDTHGAYSGGVFTAPAKGTYRECAGIGSAAVTLSTTNLFQILILKNGSTYAQATTPGTGGTGNTYTAQVCDLISLNGGDTTAVQVRSGLATTASTSAGANWFSIERVGL